jgi:hypothetical protein
MSPVQLIMATGESELLAGGQTDLVQSISAELDRLDDLQRIAAMVEGLNRLSAELSEVEQALRAWLADAGTVAETESGG